MRALPMLEARRGALEKCVYCPKLSRSACPVSNADPRETVTPWGKMSLAWMAAHGDVPIDRSHAAPAWACTACFACRELCEHENPVADVLLDARAALGAASPAAVPEGASRVVARFAGHEAETRNAARALAAAAPATSLRPDATIALLVGCAYMRSAPPVARDAVVAAAALAGEPVALIDTCCGLPLRLAGDADGFARHARAVARSLERRRRVIVVDAGCAYALRRQYADAGVELGAPVDALVEVAARSLSRLSPWPPSPAPRPPHAVRWHDPCQLGRGLGVYDAPRAVLARILGRAPDEFVEARRHAACSGAGGLVPSTMPHVARDIAAARVASHDSAGGGRLVTGCASSLIAFRKAIAAAGSDTQVDDLVSWIARATGNERFARA
jgi:Fe-S oxidoreductase